MVQSLVIKHLGLSTESRVPFLETAIQPISLGSAVPQRLPYAPRMKRVIELSLNEAEQQEQMLITPEYLFLGILKEAEEGGGVATYILGHELGIDLTQLAQQVRSAMRL